MMKRVLNGVLFFGIMAIMLIVGPAVGAAMSADAAFAPQAGTTAFKFTEVKPRVFTPEESSNKANRCTFIFDNPDYEVVTIRIFNVNGCVVRDNLITDSLTSQYWDGKDSGGSYVKAGIYIYQIEVAGTVTTGTVVVAK